MTLGNLRQKAMTGREAATDARAQALDAFVKKAQTLEGTMPAAGGGRGGAAPAGPPLPTDTLWAVRGSLAGLMNSMQGADVAPTENTLAAIGAARASAAAVMARYRALQKVALTLLN